MGKKEKQSSVGTMKGGGTGDSGVVRNSLIDMSSLGCHLGSWPMLPLRTTVSESMVLKQ